MKTDPSASRLRSAPGTGRTGRGRPGAALLVLGTVLLAGCSSQVDGQAAQVTTAARTTAGSMVVANPTAPSRLVTLSNPVASGESAAPVATTGSASAPATTNGPTIGSAGAPTAPPTVTLPPSSTVTVVVTASSAPPVVTSTARRSTVTATVTRTGGATGGMHAWSQWQSPTGNISCLIGDGQVRCDINEMEFTAPKPASCSMGVPKAIAMATNKAPAFQCISDTVADPSNPVLAYGDSTHAKSFTCTSKVDGMHCTDDGSGHSFRLARGSYDLN